MKFELGFPQIFLLLRPRKSQSPVDCRLKHVKVDPANSYHTKSVDDNYIIKLLYSGKLQS